MRTAFINQLLEEAGKNDKIFLIVGDLGFSVIESFAERFPYRFLNAAIAEQNMIGIAAGLAKEGYTVYVYSIGNFPTLRCMEQIRYDVAYHNLNVRIVSVGAGYAYGSLGASHHATEELGMMRTIPNMVVCTPCDPIETKAITTLSVNYDGPMYLRLGKAGEKIVHNSLIADIRVGEFLPVIQKYAKQSILACGSILDYARHFVIDNDAEYDLYSIPFVKPLCIEQLKELAIKYNSITVLEEHQKSAGVGSAIIEQISDLYEAGQIRRYPRIKRIAINDVFMNVVGTQQSLRERAGLVL